MRATKIFKCGNSNAVRLPKEFEVHEGDIVEVFKQANDIVIRLRPTNLATAYQLLSQLPDDFFESGRKDTPPQKRDHF